MMRLRSRKLLLAMVAGLGLTVGLSPGMETTAFANSPAPAWRVLSIPAPTDFSSGQEVGECLGCEDKYTIVVENVGAVASSSSAPITVTDRLPEGVRTVATPGAEQSTENLWSCTPQGAGQAVVECTHPAPPEGVSADGGFLQTLRLPVEIEPSPEKTGVNTVTVSGGGAATVTAETPTAIDPLSFPPPFGVADLGTLLAEPGGGADTQAGDHPSSFTLNFDANSMLNTLRGHQVSPTQPVEDLRDVVVDLPPGLVGDPQATPRCPLSSLVESSEGINGYGESACPADTRVGSLLVDNGGGYGSHAVGAVFDREVFNMVAEKGYPAEFGFTLAGYPFVMYASVVGTGANTHVRVTVPGVPGAGLIYVQGAIATFFGQDAGSGHVVPFFTNPSQCSGTPPATSLHLDSYQDPGPWNRDGTPDLADPAWRGATTETPPFGGCEDLPFAPSTQALPDSSATDAPTGLQFHLHLPQSETPETLGESDLKNTVVTFPAGLTVDPSAASGLAGCTVAQIGLQDNDAPTCPPASKLGTVEVKTPLLEKPLPGSVYLAQPFENPFGTPEHPGGSLIALYIVIDDPATGVIVKIPGRVVPDPATGRLTAVFDDNPQLPFEELSLDFSKKDTNGQEPRGPLVTPSACGSYTTTSDMTPWGTPSTPDALPSSTFSLQTGCGAQGFAPSFTAGTNDPQAGGFTPFGVTFSRKDKEQDLGGIAVTLPPGLLGDIRGVAQCSEAQANAGTCGPESLLGEATATVGAGPDPYTVTGGRVYLTGPYNGGPFGLSVVVPTTAGPFTLYGNAGHGREVVRSSVRVNPSTAQATIVSDPLPKIIEGIPLQVRTVNVTVNRELEGHYFMLNPTNCSELSVAATLVSTAGAQAQASSPFAVANCASLPFKPSFTSSTSGRTSKADGASLTVSVAQRAGEANIHKVDLQLPLTLPARLTTLQKACTEKQFDADPAGCPEASVIATATATTPILRTPLTGPAYLVSHGGAAFPDVEFVLQGENGVEIVLDGATDIKHGITYSKFETVPDAPVSSFVTFLPEGPHSALAADGNLCDQKLVMPTSILGQNGATLGQNTNITVEGCPNALSVLSSRVKGTTLTLRIAVPAAGRLTAGGKGLSFASRTTGGRETVTVTVHQRKRGKLRTRVALRFTPAAARAATPATRGGGLSKVLTVRFTQ